MKSRRLLPVLLIALAALLVGACGKAPLVPDAPRGPASWMRNVATACTTSTTDASGAQVSYQFDWGDGNKSDWSEFMDGGVAFADTHAYDSLGAFKIKVRAKNSKKASGWSAPLSISVVPAEGSVAWSIGFYNAEDEDSADFSNNPFAIGPDNTAYIACNYGTIIARRQSGATWRFTVPEFDQFTAAPVVADDGTILIGCSNDFIYALNSDGSAKWRDSVGQVNAAGALAADGTAYFQTFDSMVVALNSSTGAQLWTFPTGGGNSAPVVGVDGTVYVANQDGNVYAINPSNDSAKWTFNVGVEAVNAPPAIDPSRNVLYVANNVGTLQSIDLTSGTGNWSRNVGADPSAPIVGPDGSIYISGGGKLSKLSPANDSIWTFVPPLSGNVSTPAITADGYVYVLVMQDKKNLAMQDEPDSLYAVNSDGSRRWACGLGFGLSDLDYPLSAPKLDANGLIYVGDGYQAWCVSGVSAPAPAVWPMFQHDAQNTGRAR